MCPARCDISFVIDLLADKGRQYKTTGLRRSALLAFHDPIKIGDHPRASDFMSGLFNPRHLQPKYNFIWDVEVVLEYLRICLKTTPYCIKPYLSNLYFC